MTGTADLSRAQWNAINETMRDSVTRVTIHPRADKAVEVIFHVLGWGGVRFAVERDGTKTPTTRTLSGPPEPPAELLEFFADRANA